MPTVTSPSLAEEITAALEADDLLTDYTVQVRISTRRKTLGATIEPGGQVVTLAVPATVQPADVVAAVRHLQERIARAARQSRERAPENPVKELVAGEGFEWLGRPARLRILDGTGPVERVSTGSGWWMHAHHDDIAQRGARPLIDWYCREGTAWLEREAPAWWTRLAGRAPLPALRVQDIGRKRWGLYRHTPHLVTLAWQTMQMPPRMATYLLIHELAHATRPAGRPHGPQFWAVVQRALPGYKRDQQDTHEYGRAVWMGDVTPK